MIQDMKSEKQHKRRELMIYHDTRKMKSSYTTYLFPSITSIKSSDVASYLRDTSALCIRYSARILFTISASSSDCGT